MERETGCKITIRGKGSVKEGKHGGKPQPGEDEPLHVLIYGGNEQQLDKAKKMICELLVPVNEATNEHKKAQLRELAEINGTLKERMWMQVEEPTFDRATVRCAICGEVSHPTSDCRKKASEVVLPPEQRQQIDNEYEKFLSEIGESHAPDFSETQPCQPSQSQGPISGPLPPWAQPYNGTPLEVHSIPWGQAQWQQSAYF